MDLYRREHKLNFSNQENTDKHYFIVPLKLSKQALDETHIDQDGQRIVLSYQIDRKLLHKTERLFLNGYKKEQANVIDWLTRKGLLDDANQEAARETLLRKWMLVKEDKPNNCYHYDSL
mgnify:CR=1 FL=1